MNVQGITIRDIDPQRGVLAVDLRDILNLLGEKGVQSRWEVRGVEVASGDAASTLEAISDAEGSVEGEELLNLARGVEQVVDGEFRGYFAGEATPWIVVRAVDSAAYDVESDDRALLEQIRHSFRHVEDIPDR